MWPQATTSAHGPFALAIQLYDLDRECQFEIAEFDTHTEAEWPHNSSFQVKRGTKYP